MYTPVTGEIAGSNPVTCAKFIWARAIREAAAFGAQSPCGFESHCPDQIVGV